ncbi:hypothetical protein [Mucilaginibacter sp. HD30]
MKTKHFLIAIVLLNAITFHQAAAQKKDSVSINFPLAVNHILNGNMPEALKIMNASPDSLLIKRHLILKNEINNRFTYATDRSDFTRAHHSAVDPLLLKFIAYWRRSLKEFPANQDAQLKQELSRFFKIEKKSQLNDSTLEKEIDRRMKAYTLSKGYHSLGFSKTGKYYDLQVWKTERDTLYHFKLKDETIDCPVVFMEDFVTNGWQAYATADKIHPGGWAGDQSIYCIKASYDLTSEKFLLSFLSHEGRHLKDYHDFPGLSNPDLEYRAKLTELSMVDLTLHDVIYSFMFNSNKNSKDGHQLSNYYIIRDLSREIFHKEFENDLEKWKAVDKVSIRETSYKILEGNNTLLRQNNYKYIAIPGN